MKKDGWKGDPIDVIKMPEDKLTSMDNTRILATREAGINVKAKIHDFNEKLTSEIQETRGWGKYETWEKQLKDV